MLYDIMYTMKLSQWAKSQGITYHTAWVWFKTGKMPVKAYQSATGTIIVDIGELDSPAGSGSAVYARVSSHDQKNDLDAQAVSSCMGCHQWLCCHPCCR